MNEPKLGDSYDIVKRFWREILSPIALMYAFARFIPEDLRQRYSALTGLPIRDEQSEGLYSLLLDPNIGFRGEKTNGDYIGAKFIADLFKNDQALQFAVCFDQSVARALRPAMLIELDSKRSALLTSEIFSFYYVSHAPFLFASPKRDVLVQVREAILNAGIPESTAEGTRVQTINV